MHRDASSGDGRSSAHIQLLLGRLLRLLQALPELLGLGLGAAQPGPRLRHLALRPGAERAPWDVRDGCERAARLVRGLCEAAS